MPTAAKAGSAPPGWTVTETGVSYDVQVTSNDGSVDGPARSVLNLCHTDAGVLPFSINDVLSDTWHYPENHGQGFLNIVLETRKLVFLTWYTFDTERPPEDVTAVLVEPGHRWLTALRPCKGATALLDVYLLVFKAAERPVSTEQLEGATIEIVWTDCNEAMLKCDIPTFGLSGEILIQRIVPDRVAACMEAQTQ